MKKNIFFLGIGGIGMSAIAHYFHINGYNVAGYDLTKGETCELLEKVGVKIHYEDNVDLIPELFKNKDDTLIVITPAIPQTHSELNFFKNNGFELKKRAEILGNLTYDKKTIAIAGTHGKTSVTTITTNIFANSERGCSAFLGGIAKNFKSNFLLDKNSDVVVVEADEYDRSFLQLFPDTALITFVEADHLDIYGNYENLFDAYVQFANQLKPNGNLILSENVPQNFDQYIRPDINIARYGNCNDTKSFLTDIKYESGKCCFDINFVLPKNADACVKIHCETTLGGEHNLSNFLAAATIALTNGINADIVKKGIESFIGVERRFDIHIKRDNFVYIDDYAHHPQEISAFLKAVKLIYPNKKITGIFQPHLYSRTNDFHKEFAESLEILDNIILLPIYPAREKPIYGVNSEMILCEIKNPNKQICDKQKLFVVLDAINTDVLVSMGAGDIDRLVVPITEKFYLEQEKIY